MVLGIQYILSSLWDWVMYHDPEIHLIFTGHLSVKVSASLCCYRIHTRILLGSHLNFQNQVCPGIKVASSNNLAGLI